MIDQDYQWLQQRHAWLYVSTRMPPEDIQYIYDIYNRITGEAKRPNGCGSCLRNTIAVVKRHYEQKQKQQP